VITLLAMRLSPLRFPSKAKNKISGGTVHATVVTPGICCEWQEIPRQRFGAAISHRDSWATWQFVFPLPVTYTLLTQST